MTTQVKDVFSVFEFDQHQKPPHVQQSESFFFSITFAGGKIRNVIKTKVFFIHKQSRYLFAFRGSNKAMKKFTSDHKHPPINLFWLCAKDTQENTEGQINGGEKQSRVKCSVKQRGAKLRGSSLQARAKLSRNKRGMTLLMKGRELTRIALAQCTRSFCQSRLQRYNKVHGYNEAWAHLSLNCVESQICFSSFLALLLHFSECVVFGDDCNCCNGAAWIKCFLKAISAHSLEGK